VCSGVDASQRRKQKPQRLPGASINDQQPARQKSRHFVGMAGSSCNINTAYGRRRRRF
jgi:hypothetical protein